MNNFKMDKRKFLYRESRCPQWENKPPKVKRSTTTPNNKVGSNKRGSSNKCQGHNLSDVALTWTWACPEPVS